MKKIYLLCVMLVVLSTYVSAQTEQGRWMLSGKTGMHFSHSFSEVLPRTQPIQTSTTINQFSINPSFGYFVADNLAVNLSSNFMSTKQDGYTAENQLSVLPGLIYFLPTTSQLRPFVQAGAGYTLSSVNNDSSNTTKFGGFAFGGGVGVSYFINRSFSLDLGAQYLQMDLKNKDNSSLKLRGQSLTGLIGFSLFL